jgi:hypothetical protein
MGLVCIGPGAGAPGGRVRRADTETKERPPFSVEIAKPRPLRQIRDCDANLRSRLQQLCLWVLFADIGVMSALPPIADERRGFALAVRYSVGLCRGRDAKESHRRRRQ